MIYIYTKQPGNGAALKDQASVVAVIDEENGDPRELQAGEDFEERDAADLRKCSRCNEQFDITSLSEVQKHDGRGPTVCLDCRSDEVE